MTSAQIAEPGNIPPPPPSEIPVPDPAPPPIENPGDVPLPPITDPDVTDPGEPNPAHTPTRAYAERKANRIQQIRYGGRESPTRKPQLIHNFRVRKHLDGCKLGESREHKGL